MFGRLKAFLNNSVSPGGSNIHIAPFSFPWGLKIDVHATAGGLDSRLSEMSGELDLIAEMFDADRLVEGRAAFQRWKSEYQAIVGE